jgi:hypothetical protein
MKKAELKSFGKPDEFREFPKGRLYGNGSCINAFH